jgi:hypothetical protein
MGSLPIGRVEKGPAGGRLLVLSLRKDLRFTRVTINSKGPVAVDRLNWIEAVLACFELGKSKWRGTGCQGADRDIEVVS